MLVILSIDFCGRISFEHCVALCVCGLLAPLFPPKNTAAAYFQQLSNHSAQHGTVPVESLRSPGFLQTTAATVAVSDLGALAVAMNMKGEEGEVACGTSAETPGPFASMISASLLGSQRAPMLENSCRFHIREADIAAGPQAVMNREAATPAAVMLPRKRAMSSQLRQDAIKVRRRTRGEHVP